MKTHAKGPPENPAARAVLCKSFKSFFTLPGNMWVRGDTSFFTKITQGLTNVVLASSFAELEIGQI